MKIYKKITKSLLAALALPALAACNGYLDEVPKSDITTIETTFEKREDAEQWLMTCMSFRDYALADVSVNPAFWGSDEVVADEYTHTEGLGKEKDNIPGVMIAEGNQKTQNPYGNIWSQTSFYAGIGYCNMFLNKIKGTYNIQDEERQMWRGQAMACKAQLYFELIRRYGPMVLLSSCRRTSMPMPPSPRCRCRVHR